MLRRLIFAGGMAYFARRLFGGRRMAEPGYSRTGTGGLWGRRGW